MSRQEAAKVQLSQQQAFRKLEVLRIDNSTPIYKAFVVLYSRFFLSHKPLQRRLFSFLNFHDVLGFRHNNELSKANLLTTGYHHQQQTSLFVLGFDNRRKGRHCQDDHWRSKSQPLLSFYLSTHASPSQETWPPIRCVGSPHRGEAYIVVPTLQQICSGCIDSYLVSQQALANVR